MKRILLVLGITTVALVGTNKAAKVAIASGGSFTGTLWLLAGSVGNALTPFWAKPKNSLAE